jgi:hypothetical protein
LSETKLRLTQIPQKSPSAFLALSKTTKKEEKKRKKKNKRTKEQKEQRTNKQTTTWSHVSKTCVCQTKNTKSKKHKPFADEQTTFEQRSDTDARKHLVPHISRQSGHSKLVWKSFFFRNNFSSDLHQTKLCKFRIRRNVLFAIANSKKSLKHQHLERIKIDFGLILTV